MRPPKPRVFPEEDRALVWFVRNRFQLWEALVRENERAPASAADCRARLRRASRQAQRVLVARVVVTVLLAAGAVASFATVVFAALGVGDGLESWLKRVAASAGSLAFALLVVRLSLDRVLERYDVIAAFFATRA